MKLLKFNTLLFFLSTMFCDQVHSQCSELFFSEYIEGSSSNKAFEIYNPTNDTINLSDYVIYRNNNGAVSPSDSLFPMGNLAPNNVFVASNPGASITQLTTEADTFHTITFYNGDDAIWLKKISTQDTIDVIGKIGQDPGSGWPVGSGATNNNTLIRRISIQQGNTNWLIGSTEWDVYPIDMDDSLGNHSMYTCFHYDTLMTTSCDSSVSPDGNETWTSSGTYMDTIPTASASVKDTVFTVNLTILSSSSSSISETVCNSYTVPSGNETYTMSGIYMDTIPNIAGCDSIITINLTVNNSSTSTISETACNSYTVPSGNETYTLSGTYTDTIPNIAGCDSILTINLTIITVNTSVVVNDPMITSNAVGAQYKWLDCINNYAVIPGATNQNFTPSTNGDYAVEVTENNCTDTSACETISTVDISEYKLFSQLIIYPNPTEGHLLLDFSSEQQYLKLNLLSLSGQILQTKEIYHSNVVEMEIDQEDGVYLLEIVNGFDERAIIKIVKSPQ